jgi:hypothetical protein
VALSFFTRYIETDNKGADKALSITYPKKAAVMKSSAENSS